MYKYSFTSTTHDLLDAFEAHELERGGARRALRLAVGSVGLLFWGAVACTLLGVFEGVTRLQLFVWFAMGALILGAFLLRPHLRKRRIRLDNAAEQPVAINVDNSGIRAEIEGVGEFFREWNEFVGSSVTSRGMLIYFTDGVVNWLPNRVFARSGEPWELDGFMNGRPESAERPQST